MSEDEGKIVVLDAYRDEAERYRRMNPDFNPVLWLVAIGLWLIVIYVAVKLGEMLEVWG